MLDDIRLVRPLAAVRESSSTPRGSCATSTARTRRGRATGCPRTRVHRRPARDQVGFEAFVDAVRGEADRSRPLPADWVHATMLWLVDFSQSPPRYLGRLSIRHELTEFLRTVGGHIGYVIRPSAQRRGLGTRMLAMALPTAAAHGIENALVTCDDDNLASAKVILANGGVEDTGYRRKRRFWGADPTTAGRAGTRSARGPHCSTRRRDPVGAHRRSADEARPSVLAGWTVADLLAHLARSGGTLAQLAPSLADPLPISTYVSAYAAAAADIAEGTRALAVETSADRVGAIERAWRAGLAGLDRSDRGPGGRGRARPDPAVGLRRDPVGGTARARRRPRPLSRSTGCTRPQGRGRRGSSAHPGLGGPVPRPGDPGARRRPRLDPGGLRPRRSPGRPRRVALALIGSAGCGRHAAGASAGSGRRRFLVGNASCPTVSGK